MDVSNSSLTWLGWEFFISIVAGLGGAIVLRGLWLEWKADKPWHSNIDGFRQSKTDSKHGEKLVMVGIIVEIAVAVLFAAKDGWEIKQITTKLEWRTISDEKRAALVNKLKLIPKDELLPNNMGPTGGKKIWVLSSPSDPEAVAFRNRIESAFNEAGISVRRDFGSDSQLPYPKGLTLLDVVVNTSNPGSIPNPHLMQEIRDAFAGAHIQLNERTNDDGKFLYVQILVGPK